MKQRSVAEPIEYPTESTDRTYPAKLVKIITAEIVRLGKPGAELGSQVRRRTDRGIGRSVDNGLGHENTCWRVGRVDLDELSGMRRDGEIHDDRGRTEPSHRIVWRCFWSEGCSGCEFLEI